MAKFRFSLSAVLRLRNRKRDECLHLLAKAVEVLQLLEKENQHILVEQEKLTAFLRQQSGRGEVDVDTLSRCHLHLSALQNQNRDNLRQCEQAQHAVDLCRAQLVEADQQVKILEKLEEKQWEAFRREEEQQNLREQEDVISMMSQRTTP